MTRQRLLILLVTVLVVVAGAFWLAGQRNPAREGATLGKVLPTLAGELNSVTQLRIVIAGDKNAVTLDRDQNSWKVAERSGYPADPAKLRKLLIDLGELKVVEEKTENPENYAKLGVEDTAAASASGVRVDLQGLKSPASLIVGKSSAGGASYVRVAGQAKSLLAKPQLSVEREPANWLDRTIADIAVERVQRVRVTSPGAKPYEITRDSRTKAEFDVPAVPKGKALSSPSMPQPIAAALDGLALDDVQRAADAGSGELHRAEYWLFDGTTVNVTGRKDGERHFIRLEVGFDPALHARFASKAEADKPAPQTAAQARKEAEALGARVSGWVYEVPAYKFETLFRPLADLLSSS
jgi:hypothetical protein